MKAIISGGGISGFANACSLLRSGVFKKVVIKEQYQHIREVGAGLSLWPNAIQALDAIDPDLTDTIVDSGEYLDDVHTFNADGKPLVTISGNEVSERYNSKILMIHREKLLQALQAYAHQLSSSLGAELEVNVGWKVAGFQHETAPNNGIAVDCHCDGKSAFEQADLLIGADGVHSAIRDHLTADNATTPLQYAGFTAWRGITQVDANQWQKVKAELTGLSFGRNSLTTGLFPLPDRFVYWWITEKVAANGKDPQQLLPHLLDLLKKANWNPAVIRVIETTAADNVLPRTDAYDRDTLPAPYANADIPVTLTGDAAHLLTPALGQGAGQALEDAACLFNLLLDSKTNEDTLCAVCRKYESKRADRAATLLAESRVMNGLFVLEGESQSKVSEFVVSHVPKFLARQRLDAALTPIIQ